MDKLNRLTEHLKPSKKMPVLFVGHGSPMHAIQTDPVTDNWEIVGQQLPKPQAVVVISAHWLTRGTHITDAPKQPIIYDFYGFPDELYKATYNAKGDPELAKLLRQELVKYEAALDSSWGLDHGTWSVLKHLLPEPDVPVLQISLDMTKSLKELLDVFKQLKPLRQKGVLFIGSGNIVHNLRAMRFDDGIFDWALEFDDHTKQAIDNYRLDSLTNPHKAGHAGLLAVPTDDHYRPMLAVMALLDNDEGVDYFNDKFYDYGSAGMRSFISHGTIDLVKLPETGLLSIK